MVAFSAAEMTMTFETCYMLHCTTHSFKIFEAIRYCDRESTVVRALDFYPVGPGSNPIWDVGFFSSYAWFLSYELIGCFGMWVKTCNVSHSLIILWFWLLQLSPSVKYFLRQHSDPNHQENMFTKGIPHWALFLYIIKLGYTGVYLIFSSPEPKAHRWAYSIPMLRRPSVVRRPPFSKIFSSETTWPIKSKLHVEHP